MKKMSEMEDDVEAYKEMKAQYTNLENEYNELNIKLRENELQAQIEIEKEIVQRERELRKEFEVKIRKVDVENINPKMEIEQLKEVNNKEN